jgi:undecaprenyl-diphosphatase
VTRVLFWLSVATFFLGVFVKMTFELYESSELAELDRTVLAAVGNMRTEPLNRIAVNITALGSQTVLWVLTIPALLLLMLNHETRTALYFLTMSAGTGAWTVLAKYAIGRPRPEVIPHLVEMAGESYPSGHTLTAAALYLALAFLACRYAKSWRIRVAWFCIAGVLVLLIGISRIYLGVHYPSDVVSGICLGSAWTFLLIAIFSRNSPVA